MGHPRELEGRVLENQKAMGPGMGHGWGESGPHFASLFVPCLIGAQTWQDPRCGQRESVTPREENGCPRAVTVSWPSGTPRCPHLPSGLYNPPKTTAPVVLVAGCLWRLKQPFLVILSAFQSTAPRLGTGGGGPE